MAPPMRNVGTMNGFAHPNVRLGDRHSAKSGTRTLQETQVHPKPVFSVSGSPDDTRRLRTSVLPILFLLALTSGTTGVVTWAIVHDDSPPPPPPRTNDSLACTTPHVFQDEIRRWEHVEVTPNTSLTCVMLGIADGRYVHNPSYNESGCTTHILAPCMHIIYQNSREETRRAGRLLNGFPRLNPSQSVFAFKSCIFLARGVEFLDDIIEHV